MSSNEHGFETLVQVWRDARRWGKAHPDLREHYERRYQAFAAAFRVDLDECPTAVPPMPDWMSPYFERPAGLPEGMRAWRRERWHHEVHRFTLKTEERYRSLSGPFSGYLEIPAEMRAIRDRLSPRVAMPLSSLRSGVGEMIVELLRLLYPGAALGSATDDDLRAHGFDPLAVAPDPDDYW